jgi:hypothetical protein
VSRRKQKQKTLLVCVFVVQTAQASNTAAITAATLSTKRQYTDI